MDTIVILANGDWSDDVQARRLAAGADYIIAADGGYAKARRAGVRADLVVGDFDSLGPEEFVEIEAGRVEFRRFPHAKDSSDLELALDAAIARRPRAIVIVGALGRRVDHALSNLHLLERGADAGVDVRLVDGRQSVAHVRGRHEVDGAAVGDTVSLVPLSATARVSTTGLRYALRDEDLARASSRGVSNEVASLPALVTVSQGDLLLIHQAGGGAA